jgi:hypothetical protein
MRLKAVKRKPVITRKQSEEIPNLILTNARHAKYLQEDIMKYRETFVVKTDLATFQSDLNTGLGRFLTGSHSNIKLLKNIQRLEQLKNRGVSAYYGPEDKTNPLWNIIDEKNNTSFNIENVDKDFEKYNWLDGTKETQLRYVLEDNLASYLESAKEDVTRYLNGISTQPYVITNTDSITFEINKPLLSLINSDDAVMSNKTSDEYNLYELMSFLWTNAITIKDASNDATFEFPDILGTKPTTLTFAKAFWNVLYATGKVVMPADVTNVKTFITSKEAAELQYVTQINKSCTDSIELLRSELV